MQPQGQGSLPSILWSYDLSPITASLTKKGIPEAQRIEQEFRRFAGLCYLHPQKDLAPSKTVDEFWHELILDTRTYRDFCVRVFGEYLDHIPDRIGEGMESQFAETVMAYTTQFGTPEQELWGEPGNSMVGKRV